MEFRQDFDWGAVESSDPRDALFAHLFSEAVERPRVALFGAPFDGAVIGRPGAREGPRALREELARLKPHSFGEALTFRVADRGDVPLHEGVGVAKAHDAVEQAARAVSDAGAIPFAVGGDHSLTYPLAKPHGERHRLGVLNIDAHLDLREVHGGRVTSGTPFGRLLDDGLVRGENVAEVGVRDFATSPHYAERAEAEGVTVITAEEVRRGGVRAALEKALDACLDGADALYISVDVDALDQAHGPGVSAPTPGGLTTGELFALARGAAASAPVAGVDIVELAPPLDPTGATARAAAYCAAHVLAGLHRGVR